MLGAMRAQRDNHALAAMAAKQHRIFSRIQAFDAGFSDEDLKYRVETGEWVRQGWGAFSFRGASPDWFGLAQAALFDAGHGAVLSHGAAARLERMPGFWLNPVEILVPRALDHRCDLAIVHESRRFDRIPTTVVQGLPCTTPEATVVLLARSMRMGRLSWFVDELISGKRVNTQTLHRVADGMGGRGVAGSARLK